jgi:protein O-GlcNAc transferase
MAVAPLEPSQAECDQIVSFYNAGQLAELGTSARLLFEKYPDSGIACKLWGGALQRLGQDSRPVLQRAAEFLPYDPETHCFLAMAFSKLGRNAEAIASFRRALELNPKFASAYCRLATVFWNEGALVDAEDCLRHCLEIEPNYGEALKNLANLLNQRGLFDEAQIYALKAMTLNPMLADTHLSLGVILRNLGRLDEAKASFQKALAIEPAHAKASVSIGNIEADRGNLSQAEQHFRVAIHTDSNLLEAYIGLSLVLFTAGRLAEAELILRQAISINPTSANVQSNLGFILMDLQRPDEAILAFKLAQSIDPLNMSSYTGLGTALNRSGKPAEAEAAFRHAIAIDPNYPAVQSNLLALLNFSPEGRKDEILALAHAFDARFCLPHRDKWPVHMNNRDPERRLRIGYVSPDFRQHAVAFFLEPILARHDKSRVEVFCYSGVTVPDEYTTRFCSMADHWRSTLGQSDDAVAQTICEDQIDILVDLAGHTQGNRLLVFARKPAPIQLSYLGYPGTTGLSAMDYRIVDRYVAADEMVQSFNTERLLCLSDSLWCYRPTQDMPAPSQLPALSAGFVTFGSFNNFNKIDQSSIELWIELLRAMPSSRLILVTVPEGEVRHRVLRQFIDGGVDGHRLEFRGKMSHTDFHRKFQEVDISLDPINVNGATTTCESLWMGVPVISLVGRHFLTRAGFSILSAAGVTEFAASSRADYIRIAVDLAADLPRLAAVRSSLRAVLAASPLTDEVRFTDGLENLYRNAWRQWCATDRAD